MEAARQRKEEERLKIQREEERKWKEIQSYNPWGKPGAGAPAVCVRKRQKIIIY
jgi:alpha-glucuronidase